MALIGKSGHSTCSGTLHLSGPNTGTILRRTFFSVVRNRNSRSYIYIRNHSYYNTVRALF